MPYSQSASPGRPLTTADRTSSTTSIGRSPPVKSKGHRAHLAGHGRVHTRNPSYGKNLNKLAKVTDGVDAEGAPLSEGKRRAESTSEGKAGKAAAGGGGKSSRAGSGSDGKAGKTVSKGKGLTSPTSPSVATAMGLGAHKRNSSTVSLPRTGSKVNVKRNSSSISLIKNTSQAQLQKNNRPVTPLRKNHSRGTDLDKLGQHRETRFILDDDEEEVEANPDDEWTEESASQSPSVTRYSSKRTSGKVSPVDEMRKPEPERPNLPVSPPISPHMESPSAENGAKSNHTSSYVAVSHPHHASSRPPDADMLTSRLLGRNTSFKLEPKISSISATGTPGTHTPPTGPSSQDQPDSSLPEHGISRFLGAPSSGSAMGSLNRKSSFSGPSSIRSSPPNASSEPDAIRRVKSSGNLNAAGRPTVRLDSPERDSGSGQKLGGLRSYTFEPAQQRRGNFTKVRMELWRNQTSIEPSHGPPAPIISRLPVAELGMEERRVRQWEEAELQMGHLKRYRNPLVDGAKRALRIQGEKETKTRESADKLAPRKSKDRTAQHRERGDAPHPGADGAALPEAGSRARSPNRSRPTSRHDHRAFHEAPHHGSGGGHRVRFEVGLDGEEGPGGDEEPGNERERELDGLIRGLWAGSEGGKGGDD